MSKKKNMNKAFETKTHDNKSTVTEKNVLKTHISFSASRS